MRGVPLERASDLSLLPAEELVRTSLGGHIEHATAYAGTAFVIGRSYPSWGWKWIATALVIYRVSSSSCRLFPPQAAIPQYWTGFQVLRAP